MSTPNLKFEVKEKPDLDVDVNQPITSTNFDIKHETVNEFDSSMEQIKDEQLDEEESDVSEADYESSEFKEDLDNDEKLCAGCDQLKKIKSNSMCGSCYRIYLKEKHQDSAWKQKYYRICVDCKEFKEHCGRGLCRSCYDKIWHKSKEDLEEYAKKYKIKRRKKIFKNNANKVRMMPYLNTIATTSDNEDLHTICSKCHDLKKLYCQSLCKECYMRDLEDQEKEQNNFIICANCNEKKQNHLFGLCRVCFDIIQGGSKGAECDQPVVKKPKQEIDDTLSDSKADVKPEIVSD